MARGLIRLLALAVVVAGAIQLGSNLTRDDPPDEGSADVGFARDMRAHHAQAVEMAELVRDRTRDPDLRVVAADIALTQQAQIGQMRGWLDAWGLPPTSTDPPMAWAHEEGTSDRPDDANDSDGDDGRGAADDGESTGDQEPMPGLASEQEIAELTDARDEEAEVLFLQLMVRHHEGGVHMALTAAEVVEEGEVQALARTIAESQVAEIRYLKALLSARDAEPLPSILPEDTTDLGQDAAGDDRQDDPGELARRWWLVGIGGIVLVALVRDLLRRPRPSTRPSPRPTSQPTAAAEDPIAPEESEVATVTKASDEHLDRDDDRHRFPADDSGFDDL